MSVPVRLESLRRTIDEYGRRAYLISVAESGRAHVVSVIVTMVDTALVAPAGRSTAANVTARPAVTLVWASPPGGEYSLIVDGDATLAEEGGEITVVPSTAVLHRLAGSDGAGPSCVPVPVPD